MTGLKKFCSRKITKKNLENNKPKHKAVLKEIDQDKAEKYAGHELVVVDEYETKLKRNLGYYLAVLMMENEDNSTVFLFRLCK